MNPDPMDGSAYYIGGPPPPTDGDPGCPSRNPKARYLCTLSDGHRGQHVAGTFSEAIAVWPNADGPMPADDEPDEGDEGDEQPGTMACDVLVPDMAGFISAFSAVKKPARLPHTLYWTGTDGALRPVDDFDDEPDSYELTLLRAALHWHAETLP